MKGIVWLASYPKSGNTWFRAFLTNLRTDRDEPADINHLDGTSLYVRDVFDAALGWETADLPADAADSLREAVQMAVAQGEDVVMKTHDAFVDPASGKPLICPSATRAAVYIIRNPLDVAVSYANHTGRDLDSIVRRLNDRHAYLGLGPGAAMHLKQVIGDWSWHVTSWVEAPGLSRLIIRYEDMLKAPLATFLGACRFLGLTEDPARVDRAIRNSQFGVLQEQEKNRGFRERTPKSARFFLQGRAGAWREKLSPSQVSAIIEPHREVMLRFGYLGQDGAIAD